VVCRGTPSPARAHRPPSRFVPRHSPQAAQAGLSLGLGLAIRRLLSSAIDHTTVAQRGHPRRPDTHCSSPPWQPPPSATPASRSRSSRGLRSQWRLVDSIDSETAQSRTDLQTTLDSPLACRRRRWSVPAGYRHRRPRRPGYKRGQFSGAFPARTCNWTEFLVGTKHTQVPHSSTGATGLSEPRTLRRKWARER